MVSDSPWLKTGTKCMKARFVALLREGKILKVEWHKRLYGDASTCIELWIMEQEKAVAKLKIKEKTRADTKSTSQSRKRAEEEAL